MRSAPNPKCIVCGKQIKKRMTVITFIPATANGRKNGDRKGNTIYLDEEHRPMTVEECQKYTNHKILRHSEWSDGGIFSFTYWEGEWEDEYFHSERCAAKQGRASAQHGARFTWG